LGYYCFFTFSEFYSGSTSGEIEDMQRSQLSTEVTTEKLLTLFPPHVLDYSIAEKKED